MSRYDTVFDLQKCRSLWPVFHVPVTLPYILKSVWCMNIILQDCESVWPNIWPQNKCRSLWPMFHGLVILPYILKTICCMNIIHWDYESAWHDIWPKINVGHCDLYFMVQWFCHISWRLFDVWTSLFRIMNQYDPKFDLKIKYRSLWPIFHGPVILPYILKTIWCMNIIIWASSRENLSSGFATR